MENDYCSREQATSKIRQCIAWCTLMKILSFACVRLIDNIKDFTHIERYNIKSIIDDGAIVKSLLDIGVSVYQDEDDDRSAKAIMEQIFLRSSYMETDSGYSMDATELFDSGYISVYPLDVDTVILVVGDDNIKSRIETALAYIVAGSVHT